MIQVNFNANDLQLETNFFHAFIFNNITVLQNMRALK